MKKLFVIFTILFISIVVDAQAKKFNFEFDYAQFAYDSSSNYIEIYYSFGQQSLLRDVKDTVVYLEGILHIEVHDSLTGKEILKKNWQISYAPQDTSDLNNSLVGVIGITLPEGKYEFLVTGEDSLQSNFLKSAKEYITVRPFMKNKISMSDVQFASKIIQDSPNKNSVFYKNTYEVIPFPTLIYGGDEPVLFYYLELYNLKTINDKIHLELSTLVYNSSRQLVFNKSKLIAASVNSRVDVGTVLINKYPTDSYTLIISLIDSIDNFELSSSKRFYVYNPSVKKTTDSLNNKSAPNIITSQFDVMSEEELNKLFQESKYIATQSEVEQYGKLNTLEGKRKFINQFWRVRDPNPSTPKNEFYLEYMNRIEHCNQVFSTLGKKGWETDRGRVYLQYGKPSEIERFPNQIDTKPYEIWHYNDIQGGVIFVFADLTNFSDYQLIHSTARGELRDDNWQNRINSL
jgi:GWxTD domain-containing protein